MLTSENIDQLATALSKAQGEITGALKDSANPFFKSKYADLASCWDACRQALSKNGLAVLQAAETVRGDFDLSIQDFHDPRLALTTTLSHASGQWVRSTLLVIPKDDSPQAMGSALTYARRYALTAMVGIAQVDDDGNAASGRVNGSDAKADLGKAVPLDRVRTVAMEMLAIIDKPAADGDHDEAKKALDALDYHERVLNPDEDLYIAVGEQLTPSKRNVWKALVNKARLAEKVDRQVTNAGRKF